MKALILTLVVAAGLVAAFVYLSDVDRATEACLETALGEVDAPKGSLGETLVKGLSDAVGRPVMEAAVRTSDDPVWQVHLRCLGGEAPRR